jgi:ABC-type nitrate/sulfonate/bicarbonate transport system substrate-binding protein
MFRRAVIAATMLAAAGPLASTSVQAQAPTIVTRGTVSSTGAEWPDIVAREKGFYAKEGLKVDQVLLTPTTITPSLIGGSIDFGFLNAAQMIQADITGADLVAIGQGMDPAPYNLVAGKAIKSLADLKGKTISLAEQYDAYAEVTREILLKAGLDPEKDVNFRYGGNSNQRMAALVAGAVDAVPLLAPQDKMMLDQGFNGLAFYPDYHPHLALSLTSVNRTWAAAHADIVKAFMRAQKNAITWLNDPANKDEAIALLMKATSSDKPSSDYAYEVYLKKLRIFPADGCIQTQGLETLIQIMSKVNPKVKGDLPTGNYVARQYCAG